MTTQKIRQHFAEFRSMYFIQAVFTGCFYGIRAIFVLYALNHFHWGHDQTIRLFSTFMALCYGTSIIGGYIADKGPGVKNTIIMGGISNALGFLMMLIPDENLFFLGLALAVFGSGLVKPNIAAAAGLLVDRSQNSPRDKVYSFLYIAMNVGNLAAPLVCGFVGKTYGWHYGILLLATILMGGVYFVFKKIDLPSSKEKPSISKTFLLPAILLLISTLYILFKYQESLHGLMAIITGCSVIYLGNIFYKCNPKEKKDILRIIVYILLFAFFCTLYEQAGTSLMLFYEKAVNRDVMGIVVPASAFLSLDPLFVLILGPVLLLLSGKFLEKTGPLKGFVKIGVGFLFIAASFGILSVSAYYNQTLPIPVVWVVMAFFVQTMGELWIAPITFSKISQYAPLHYKSVLMSFWQMAIAYGHYLAGFVAQFSVRKDPGLDAAHSLEQYQTFFLRLSLAALCVGLSLLLCKWIGAKIPRKNTV